MPAAKQNIENNPMQSSMVSLAWMFSAIPRKNIFDTSGKSAALLHHHAI
jgi:hypothetical protein